MEPLDLHNKQGLYTKVTLCHISTSYYTGFCYLMMRRYLDAIRVFNSGLSFIARIKQYHSRSSGYDQILQKMEQMYAARPGGAVPSEPVAGGERPHLAQEKHAEKIQDDQSGSVSTSPAYACPSSSPHRCRLLELGANTSSEAYKLQLKMFLTEISRDQLPVLKQYLLTHLISVSKLTHLMGSEAEQLLTLLMRLKHKTSSSADTDFIVDVTPQRGGGRQIGDIKMQKSTWSTLGPHLKLGESARSDAAEQQRSAQGGW